MFPVLFSVGGFPVSSYGVFLALGFLFGIFLIWRLARAWDLDEEVTLDLTLLTFLGGMFGARVYFAIENWQLFASSPLNFILINKVAGFSFWGGFLGGWLTLFIFSRRKRLNFWQLADIATVGLLGGLIFANLGCFLGGCNIGTPSKAFFAVTQAGTLGKRWPVGAIEAFLFLIVLIKIWSQATHFHQRGKIVGITFTFGGIIGLILAPFKNDHSETIFLAGLTLLGLTIFYKVTKQNPLTQLKKLTQHLAGFFTNPQSRTQAVQILNKNWYNQKAAFSWKIRNLKKLLRRSNVRIS